MTDPQPDQFLDVPTLLERSQPLPRHGWFWYAAGVFLLIVLLSVYGGSQSAGMRQAIEIVSSFMMIGLMIGMAAITTMVLRRHRGELRLLEAIEELIQLRRWPEAAAALGGMLSAPTRTPQARVQALYYLSTVLARYHRFEDAIFVHSHLLETVNFDDNTGQAIRLGRAMAMLREDHLVDADRAFSELRRQAQGRDSSGLALIEIYRDVKTGHPAEAIERFERSLSVIQQQLGHRTGDAWALVAKAYDMLGRGAEAQSAYENATLLSPLSELHRRYPEVVSLSAKFQAAQAPKELS